MKETELHRRVDRIVDKINETVGSFVMAAFIVSIYMGSISIIIYFVQWAIIHAQIK